MKIYEFHPKMFINNSYNDILDYIEHFKKLNIDTLQWMPLHLTNNAYGEQWGYSPINYLQITDKYGTEEELRYVLKELETNGIQNILDVVYNHTGNIRLFEESWFLKTKEGYFHNMSGCGNTFNCSHPEFKNHIIESLIYFKNLGFNGYRFDLAPVLGYDDNLNFMLDNCAAKEFEKVEELKNQIFIAEPWCMYSYNLGQFPQHWLEQNDKFRDSARDYMNGKITDIYKIINHIKNINHKYIGFISCHDGFTLHDIVSYNNKHNDENGENNNDGTNDNHSYNNGYEGVTGDYDINIKRIERMKIGLALTILFNKHYMLLAGDEVSRTQYGNNNSYKKIYPFDFNINPWYNHINDINILSKIHDDIDYNHNIEILNHSLGEYNDIQHHYKFMIIKLKSKQDKNYYVILNSSSSDVEHKEMKGMLLYANKFTKNNLAYKRSISVYIED